MTNDKGILIHNIYYMLSYAFIELKNNNYEDVKKEDFEQIMDLFAEILWRGVSAQLKQGLFREYVNQTESLPTLRGRIEINGTIRNLIQQRRELVCEYDTLSENNLLNRILKSTMTLLTRDKDVDSKRKKQLRSILPFFDNVSEINLSEVRWNNIQYQRNNRNYRMMLTICRFIHECAMMTTETGDIRMSKFTETHMNRLFELFVLNYYKRHHPSLRANADTIKWNIDSEESIGIEQLPSMQSDITLHYNERTLIIDTKYYGNMMQNQYNKHTIHSANLYQIFTYVKNHDKEKNGNVTGMLLYAKTNDNTAPHLDTTIGGNRIIVDTLDLNQEFDGIRNQLDSIAKTY